MPRVREAVDGSVELGGKFIQAAVSKINLEFIAIDLIDYFLDISGDCPGQVHIRGEECLHIAGDTQGRVFTPQ